MVIVKDEKNGIPQKKRPAAAWAARYARIRGRLARTGFIIRGSINETWVRCGYARCACRRPGNKLHGPYFLWTTKVKGKTVTRSLSPEEARLYKGWVKNRQRLEATIEELLAISRQVARGKLKAKEPFIPGA